MRLPAALPLLLACVAHAQAVSADTGRQAASADTGRQAVLLDRIVAVVDTQCITRSAVDEHAARMKLGRDAALNELIERLLIDRDAIKLGLTITEADIDSAVEQVLERNQLDRAAFEKALAEQHFTLDSYREEIGRQILELKWLSLKQNRDVRPESDEARAKFLASERQRLVAELKKKAAVEVRR